MAPAAGTRSSASNSRSKVTPASNPPKSAPSRSKRKVQAVIEPAEESAAKKKKKSTLRPAVVQEEEGQEEGGSFVDPFSEVRYDANAAWTGSVSTPSWEPQISVEEAVRRGPTTFLDPDVPAPVPHSLLQDIANSFSKDASPAATNPPKSWAIDPSLAEIPVLILVPSAPKRIPELITASFHFQPISVNISFQFAIQSYLVLIQETLQLLFIF
ncbi:hypothetical protein B0H13DRAFT_2309253 [Mycena leptocephala]|nr:hypothetical protein B0H13DRAFT_2309253 [Mycena leptocephala]